MADNSQKTPVVRSLSAFAERKALDAIAVLGKALPCSVAAVVSSGIVTVSFRVTSSFTLPNVTVPMIGPEYVRYPTQVGDLGFVIAADASLGGVSGLGKGTANLSLQGNLSALAFVPCGNKNWSMTDDPNAVVIYGPSGVILKTVTPNIPFNSTLKVGLDEIRLTSASIVFDGPVTFEHTATGAGGNIDFGNTNLTTTGTANLGAASVSGAVGAGSAVVAGSLTAGGKNVGGTHEHGGVTVGGGTTGVPV